MIEFGMFPLFEQLYDALNDADLAQIRRLLAEGADPNETNDVGYGPMHERHDVEIYRLLVEAGGDVNSVSGGGTRALAECASMGDIAGVSYLLSVGAKPDLGDLPACDGLALHMAVAGDKLEIVKLVLEAGADINLQDADGLTCLWWLKSIEIAAFLLRRGADPSISAYNTLPENHDSIPEAIRKMLLQHRIGNSQKIEE